MITVNNLTVAWGGFTLLEDINLHIGDTEKVGLVGKNGAGKSTLLKIIMGLQQSSAGSVTLTKGEKLGYLPQQMEHAKERSVMDEALKAFDALFALHRKIDELYALLNDRTDYESASYNNIIVELNNLQDRVLVMESEPPRSQAEKILTGLGFRPEEFDRPTSTLSQGWNMRIELAKILLSKPDALLLDEPTNHLDIESIQWFEDYLKAYRGSVMLISHDRKFLDNVTKRTVEIMLGKVHDYKVSYSQYKALRAERMEQQRAAYQNQQRMIEKTEDFIERFRYKATKSNQVQSRIKALEKLERVEVEIEDRAALSVKFPPAPRSGQVVYKCEELKIGYGQKVVAERVNMVIQRGEKVAFVGRNGEGKTTMLRGIIGELAPLGGEESLGHNVSLGYYAQNQDEILDKNDTVLATLDRIATGEVRTRLRDILGAFLFKGEDIDKKVAVLSGGERARLAMAKLILKPYNLLVLDEPTNHMDLVSKDILKQALINYDGTLVIVSHDRDFLDGLVDKVYEFKDGRVKEHLGGIVPYLEHLREQEKALEMRFSAEASLKNKPVKSLGKAEKPLQPDGCVAESQKFREESKQLRRKRKEIEKLENEIAELDHRLAELEIQLSQEHTPEEITKLSALYEHAKKDRDAKMELWMELSD